MSRSNACKKAEYLGTEVIYLPVKSDGKVCLEKISETKNGIELISLIFAKVGPNNEGVGQDVGQDEVDLQEIILKVTVINKELCNNKLRKLLQHSS